MTGRRLLVCLLAAAAPLLHGQSYLFAGVGTSYASQPTASLNPWGAESLGVSLHSYSEVAAGLGVYAAATLGFIVASQESGGALDTGRYQTASLNFLAGVGTGIVLDRLIGVIGAGFYLGENTLTASDNTLSSYPAGGVGGGIGASVVYALSYSWGLGVNVNAAYYFAIPGTTAETMGPSGFCVFGGIGVVYYLRPATDLGPSVSRY